MFVIGWLRQKHCLSIALIECFVVFFPLPFFLYFGLINIIWVMCLSQGYIETGMPVCQRNAYACVRNAITYLFRIEAQVYHHLRHRHSVVCEKYDSWSLDRFFFSVPAHATCFHWSAPRLDCRGLTWNRHHRKRMDVLLRLFTWMHPCMGK